MRFDGGAVDENLLWRTARAGERAKQIAPNALRRPPDIAIVQRLSRPVDIRGIDPATAGLQHMHDAANHPAVVNPRLATRVRRQVRSNARELSVGQPEIISTHHGFLPETVNHTPFKSPTILWVRALIRRIEAALTTRGATDELRDLYLDAFKAIEKRLAALEQPEKRKKELTGDNPPSFPGGLV
jgi:hypothetical protein